MLTYQQEKYPSSINLLSLDSALAQVCLMSPHYSGSGGVTMKQVQTTTKPPLHSSDTLFRPDFMLQPTSINRLATAQLGQRKALNTAQKEETNELIEIAWWQDR
jgi:hypothetical protein